MQNRRKSNDSQLSQVVEFAQVMLSYHSDDTLLHFQHVKRYTKLICLKYNSLYPKQAIPEKDLPYIYEGARLHDIGKISIPDNLLRKRDALTSIEYDEMRKHTVIGAQIIDRMADICGLGRERGILHDICMYHHERYDGTGYPEGLKGDEIPLSAQIVSIAESYGAMTERNYKDPISHEEAIDKILSGECGPFNPKLIECLRRVANDLYIILTSSTSERWELLEGVYSKSRRGYWYAKRVMDILLASLALLVLSPLMAIIGTAIFIDDPHGSPIFKQTRLGRHKKPFTMYKFRTMVVNAEQLKAQLMQQNEKDGPVFKISKDPRITRIGRILRKTSLDELPQLVNIIKGDMTIVGPRPPLPSEVSQYSRYHEMRLSVTPGLTCIWQMQPKRDSVSFEEWVDMDVGYIGTRSIWQDLRIIFRTALSVLHKSGS